MNATSDRGTAASVFRDYHEAQTAVKALQNRGSDVRKRSIVGDLAGCAKLLRALAFIRFIKTACPPTRS